MVDGAVCGMRPCVGLSATSPQCPAGRRTEPAISEPTEPKPMPDARDAPAPALDPPVLRVRSHGLRVIPYRELTPAAIMPMSGIVVLPRMTAPASFNRAAGGASTVDIGRSAFAAIPCRHGIPTACTLSLMVTGMPSRSPRARPDCRRSVAAWAAARAPGSSTYAIALITGSVIARCSRVASSSSRGVVSPVRKA